MGDMLHSQLVEHRSVVRKNDPRFIETINYYKGKTVSYIDIPFAVKAAFDGLPEEKQQQVYSMWQSEKKSEQTALILAIFGFSLFYVGKAGLGILMLVTGGGCWVWWIIEMTKAKKRAEEANVEILQRLIMQVR